MWWLDDIIVPAVLILGVSCFVLLVRSSTRRSARKTTTRTAEDLYPLYADSIRKQRKYAKEHGGQWRDDEGSGRPRLSGQQPGRPTPIPAQARSGHALRSDGQMDRIWTVDLDAEHGEAFWEKNPARPQRTFPSWCGAPVPRQDPASLRGLTPILDRTRLLSDPAAAGLGGGSGQALSASGDAPAGAFRLRRPVTKGARRGR